MSKHQIETIILFSIIFAPYIYAMYVVFNHHGI
jgi:hypothetical protein